MPVRLPLFTDVPSHTYQITLDGVQYGVKLVYRERTASWYLDVHDENGAALVVGRRLTPGWSPVTGMITGGPPGSLVVVGKDPYPRDEIELWYFTEAEVAELEPAPVTTTAVEIG